MGVCSNYSWGAVDAAPKRPEWKQDWEGWGYNTDTLCLRAPRLLLLPASSLFECQVNQRATRHVVISQGVGILDEDALRGGEKEKKKKNPQNSSQSRNLSAAFPRNPTQTPTLLAVRSQQGDDKTLQALKSPERSQCPKWTLEVGTESWNGLG